MIKNKLILFIFVTGMVSHNLAAKSPRNKPSEQKLDPRFTGEPIVKLWNPSEPELDRQNATYLLEHFGYSPGQIADALDRYEEKSSWFPYEEQALFDIAGNPQPEIDRFLQVEDFNGKTVGDIVVMGQPLREKIANIKRLQQYARKAQTLLDTEELAQDTMSLIKAGADVNARGRDGNTVLIVAAANGHRSGAGRLLQAGADVDAQNNQGGTALIVAALYGHLEIVDLLLKAGAKVDARTDDGGTALIVAASRGHLEIVDLLLQAGADVNVQNNKGGTALMGAAFNGRLDAVDSLLQAGARVDARDGGGGTALIKAAVDGHLPVVERLLKAGADVNAHDIDGWTALIWAAFKNHFPLVDRLLKVPGIKVDDQNTNGDTALALAEAWGRANIADLLRAHGTITPE